MSLGDNILELIRKSRSRVGRGVGLVELIILLIVLSRNKTVKFREFLNCREKGGCSLENAEQFLREVQKKNRIDRRNEVI